MIITCELCGTQLSEEYEQTHHVRYGWIHTSCYIKLLEDSLKAVDDMDPYVLPGPIEHILAGGRE